MSPTPVAGLEHSDVQIEFVAQRMQHVHAGESCADDEYLDAAVHVRIANELAKKIPKPGDFNNMLRGQDSAYKRLLRRGVYLVQMPLGRGFCHELPDAFVEGAVDQQISVGMTGLLETLGIE